MPRKFVFAKPYKYAPGGPWSIKMALWVLGREHHLETYRANYRGNVVTARVNDAADERMFMRYHDLIYLEFVETDERFLTVEQFNRLPAYLALCVFDIDLAGDRQQAIRGATVARDTRALIGLCAPELDVIHRTFCKWPYQVYASGSKGLHVYVQCPDLIVRSGQGPEHFKADRIAVILENVLPLEFVSLIDRSIYPHGKGIRPILVAHPQTKTVPFVLKSHGWRQNWLEWIRHDILVARQFVELCRFETLQLPIRQAAPVVANNATPPLSPVSVSTSKGYFTESSLGEWIGKPLLKQVGRYSYYADPGQGSYCSIAQKHHKTVCSSWQSFANGTHVNRCFNAKCIGKQVVVRRPVAVPVTYPPDTDIAPEKLTVLENPDGSPYLPMATMIQLFQEKSRLVLNADMGTGKTHTLVEFLKLLPPEVSILVIGSRIQQLRAWHGKFSVMGFGLYDQEEGRLFDKKRLLICLNSLPRLLSAEGDLPAIDIIVMDEIDSTARWLGGPLIGSPKTGSQSLIFMILEMLIARSRKTILMDGLPTQVTGKFLQVMGCFNAFHWVIFQSLKFKEWLFCNNTEYFTQAFVNDLEQGKKLFFVSNTKKLLNLFAALAEQHGVPRERMLLITGDMQYENRIAAGDPHDWVRYDLVLCNGSLGPGASFDHKGHFHKVYALVHVNLGVVPVDIAQLVSRVRHPVSNSVMVLVLKKKEATSSIEEELLLERKKTLGRYSAAVTPLVQVYENQILQEQAEKRRLLEEEALANGRRLQPLATPLAETRLSVMTVYDPQTGELVDTFARPGTTIRLKFETPKEMRLAAAVDHQSIYWTSCSERFMQKLQEIATRSGGVYTELQPRTQLDEKGKDKVLQYHMSFAKRLKQGKLPESYDEYATMEDNYFLRQVEFASPDRLREAKKLVAVDRPDVMSRFASIVSRYDGTHGSIEETINGDARKLFKVSDEPCVHQGKIQTAAIPRGALNRRATLGEILEPFNNLLTVMDLVFDKDKKSFTGQYNTREFFETEAEQYRDQIRDYTEALCRLRQREDPCYRFTDLRTDARVFKYVPECFAWLGFDLTESSVRARKVRNFVKSVFGEPSRQRLKVFTPNSQSFDFRVCLLGFKPGTGEQMGVQEAVDFYFTTLFDQ